MYDQYAYTTDCSIYTVYVCILYMYDLYAYTLVCRIYSLCLYTVQVWPVCIHDRLSYIQYIFVYCSGMTSMHTRPSVVYTVYVCILFRYDQYAYTTYCRIYSLCLYTVQVWPVCIQDRLSYIQSMFVYFLGMTSMHTQQTVVDTGSLLTLINTRSNSSTHSGWSSVSVWSNWRHTALTIGTSGGWTRREDFSASWRLGSGCQSIRCSIRCRPSPRFGPAVGDGQSLARTKRRSWEISVIYCIYRSKYLWCI